LFYVLKRLKQYLKQKDKKQLMEQTKTRHWSFNHFTLSTALFKMLIKKDGNIFSDSKNYF